MRILFVLFSIVAIGAAVRVVTCRRIFHAALWLIVSFFSIAAIYMLLESPFMAGVQFFLYIGGVAVLTVIAIMVTKGSMGRNLPVVSDTFASLGIAGMLFAVMVYTILNIPFPEYPLTQVPENSLELLGMALVDPEGFLLPFEVVSIMLLVVLISALYLARER